MLISIPVLRMNAGTMCMHARKQLPVDAVEQRHMVNSGARGTKDRQPQDRGALVNYSNASVVTDI
jgi:hypothetical protein